MASVTYIKKIANPRKKRAKVSSRRRRPNPLRVVTLGATNPKKRRKKNVAKRKTVRRRRRTTAAPRRRRRVTRRRRSNPTYYAPRRRRRRRANPRSATRRVTRRRRTRRNPTDMKMALPMGLGGLVGVTATKMAVANLPPALIGSNIGRIVSSGVAAMILGWAGEKALSGQNGRDFAQGMFFGGMMQTMSVALNAFLPQLGSQIGLAGRRRGMGELVSGGYPVPQNPVSAGFLPPAAPPTEMSGVARAYGRAY